MTARRVLVTRPEPGASATGGVLRATGFEPLLLPLTRTEPLDVQTVPDGSDFDTVAVTSANALRHASSGLLKALAGKRCYTVGDQTRQAAVAARLDAAEATPGSAEGMVALIASREPPGTRLLYLCGRVRRPEFSDSLTDAGFKVRELETYDTLPTDYSFDAVTDRLGWNPIWGALVYSVKGAGTLEKLVARRNLESVFKQTLFFCLSARIAEEFAGMEAKRKRVAANPNEAAMLAMLEGER